MNDISIGFETNIGCRKSQQDAAIISTNDKEENAKIRKTIAILCDGMGGMTGGELASNLCVSQIYNDFYETEDLTNYNDFLLREIDKADYDVSKLVDEEGNILNAGTTLIAVIIENNKLYWAGVGDSRLYIIRQNQILQITQDHNYLMELMEMVDNKKLTMEEAMADKDKDALISYIGINGIKYIDSNKKAFELMSGDCLLMCSDGVYRSLSDEQMKEIMMASGDDMVMAAKCFVEEALNTGNPHQDNSTAIAIKYL